MSAEMNAKIEKHKKEIQKYKKEIEACCKAKDFTGARIAAMAGIDAGLAIEEEMKKENNAKK